MDAFIDELLTEERVFGTQLTRLLARHVLEEMGDLPPRISPMQYLIDGSSPPVEGDHQVSSDSTDAKTTPLKRHWTVGICAMNSKSKSKAMSAIMERFQRFSGCELIYFNDAMLLNERTHDTFPIISNQSVADVLLMNSH